MSVKTRKGPSRPRPSPILVARWSLSGRVAASARVEPVSKVAPARPHCAACGRPTLPGLLTGGECPPCCFIRKAGGGRGA